MAFAIGVAALFAFAALINWTPGTALAADEVACNGDHALEADGFQCTPLLNKGTGTTLGEAFTARSGMTLTIYTNLFGSFSDTGHSEEKICLDDDTDPFAAEDSCIGATAGNIINDATLVPAPGNQEEGAGDYEFMIEGVQLTESTGTGSADGLGKYTVFISTYAYASFHFNNDDSSIETFFEIPGEEDIPTPESTSSPPVDETKTVVSTRTTVVTKTVLVTRTVTTTETPDPEESETPDPTETPTATPTDESVPEGGVSGGPSAPTSTRPAATPTFVDTVLAVQEEPTATPGSSGISLPSSGSGPFGLGENWAVPVLAFWMLALVGAGVMLARRNS
jgi:hypothetical protein